MNRIKAYVASTEDREKVISTITAAFIHDPIARWVWPDPYAYLRYFPAFANAFGGAALDNGTAQYTTDYMGSALWLAPGVEPDAEKIVEILQSSLTPERLDTAFNFLEQMDEYHPKEPVWHLTMIGVDPTKYGCGHGATMMKTFLERVDAAQQAAYLESSNPANIPLYVRHGFEVTTGTIQAGDSPNMYPMYRAARG